MERVVTKSRSFQEARRREIEEYQRMTPDERLAIARELQRRVYGDTPMTLREWGRQRREQ